MAPGVDPADSGTAGNERLTSIAGVVLLPLLVVELFTVLALHGLMTVHILIGVVLVGPLAVKLASAGYRFVRYYAGSAMYVRRGPPARPLRLLAPVLVGSTVVLVATGIALVISGPAEPEPLVAMHNVTFLVWLPVVAAHAIAYVTHAVELVANETGTLPRRPPDGRSLRLLANGAALVLGGIGALLLLPGAPPWSAWIQRNEAVPAPLIVGTVLTIAVLVALRPRRWVGRRTDRER